MTIEKLFVQYAAFAHPDPDLRIVQYAEKEKNLWKK